MDSTDKTISIQLTRCLLLTKSRPYRTFFVWGRPTTSKLRLDDNKIGFCMKTAFF